MALKSGLTRPIVFFGTGEFSLTALTGLVEAGYNVVAVVTKPDGRSGRGHRLTPPPVKVFAERHNIAAWQPDKLSEITEQIAALEKPAGVLASYGKIIPQSILDLFHPGIINIHPSLLPRYRGPSPIETAILNGDKTTGVSIMQLAPRMDAGPVYAAKTLTLTGNETKPELYHTLAVIGTNLLLETLPSILGGSLPALPQSEEDATYVPTLQKSDALLRPESMTAAEAERHVRAYVGFPKTKLTIAGHPTVILKARVSSTKSSRLDVLCADGNYLSIEELIAPSGRKMTAAEFERGYLTRQE